ncbi:hypothetical protein K450DRAFT_195620 [Umbelopsis ramanniana AG]|uniref:CP-type G domain-containing protein n=1 Tax=Umbelopsis ramanniana AG TaxID=1314678 RepID=A0AAD5EI04_UMBRA|nr:uncharacterized protein K450DRAFT_195620 [Umbelopsis ramanniana AG]KAI8583899.1 hypothetical protein K450DRAFT_195620 [Umbelopsis ramanniana AG]
MPRANKPTGSLGRAVIRSRFKGQKAIAVDEGKLHTTETNEGPGWVKLQSVTQEGDLDAFLHTAELAGTEFTAERLNIKVVQDSYQNPYLLSEKEEEETLKKHAENKNRLTVPRRPAWDSATTPEQLKRREQESFLSWRRGLAVLQEEEGLLLTPFERNLEVWRQLWRVIERSQLIVQIVDARNPLLFRSEDLDTYVKEVDPKKRNLLLINKADFLTKSQRRQWADYFDKHNIRYTFFSAALAAKQQEEERLRLEKEEARQLEQNATTNSDDEDEDSEEDEEKPNETSSLANEVEAINLEDEVAADDKDITSDGQTDDHHSIDAEEVDNDEDDRTRIRTTTNLLDLLIEEAPSFEDEDPSTNPNAGKLMIGLVGYPNVGKSSTINALIGEKRVSVSSTPGKTKHFQTIHLTPSIVLCDCPGLVFPTFSTTKADQVCNGVLPIDQLREFTAPSELVTKRVPKEVIEAIYGIRIRMRSEDEGGSGVPTGEELLRAYAIARGFTKSSQGNPDESRAARYILKDYVNGKLLYCHPPPSTDEKEFNKETHELQKYLDLQKKLAPTTRVPSNALNYIPPAETSNVARGPKTQAIDSSFFQAQTLKANVSGRQQGDFTRVQLFPHQNRLADDGSQLAPGGRRQRLAMVNGLNGGDPEVTGKKHKKGKKHVKIRSGAGYDHM